ncbi:hypothetical protein Gasu2_46470 [Galdieria sulphuraria]|nr:hypothetical protein Gasu2_46470 [Galdieria sulphuraria]
MGTETSLMKSLTAAFPVQSVPLHVTSTKLFGPNDVSEQLAERLALKYRCPFFISIGLDAQATEAFHLIEKKLFELLDSIRADNRVRIICNRAVIENFHLRLYSFQLLNDTTE